MGVMEGGLKAMVNSVKKKKTTKISSKKPRTPASASTTKKKSPKKETVKKAKEPAAKKAAVSKKDQKETTTKKDQTKKDQKVTVEKTEHRVSLLLNESMMPYKFEPYNPKPNEEYMSDGQLKHFRGILETWKKELMKEVDNTIIEMKGATVLADPNDRATQEEAFNLELRTRDRERKLIRKIEEALQQIDDKEYGYCESCGVEIGIRRLEARPTAVLCIDCKTLDEIRERNVQ